MTRINTNVSSLVAQNRLNKTNSDLQTSLTRLSTGLRINSGKDDPAGLIASEALRSDITSINKAISNTQRASQIIATADSALGQVSSLLNDIRGLVVEAANKGALSDDEIAANQLQVDSSLEAINRIAQTTTFQGRRLLDGSLDFVTKAGTGSGVIKDLKIDQANLGAIGQISVNIKVSTAASRATVSTTGIPAATTAVNSAGTINFSAPSAATEATGTVALANSYTIGAEASAALTFTNAYTPALEAGGTINLGSGVILDIDAVDGGAADGAVGNDTIIEVLTNTTGTSTASYDVATKTLTLSLAEGDNAAAIAADLASNADFDIVANAGTANSILSTDAGILTGELSGGTNATAPTAGLTLSAVDGGAADGVTGNTTSVVFTSGTTTGAAYDATNNVVTISIADGATISQIAAAINTDLDGDFQASNVTSGSFKWDPLDNGTEALAGGLNPTLASQFRLTAKNGGPADGTTGNTTSLVLAAAATGDPTEAAYDEDTNVLTVSIAANATTQDVVDAINLQGDFVANNVLNGNALFSATNYGTSTPISGGTDTTANDVITVTADEASPDFDGVTIALSADNALAAGTAAASLTSAGNIQVRVSSNGPVTIGAISSAINDLEGFSASVSATAGDGVYDITSDTAATTTALAGGVFGGGLNADLVVRLTGATGAEVFQFQKGASISSVIQSINLVKDATGIEAENDAGNLKLNSTTYGSEGLIDVEVISEGTGGTFKSGLTASRAKGTDIEATVNGTAATGKGNVLSLNTATLDLSLTVEDGASADISFTISGGGAQFQLGPEVVSNQQARLGIGSLNTAKLGGASGRLYELAKGGAKALDADPTGASRVVDEAINQVTSLRGRLGAFQATTLESNLVSLNETVANLTEAESSIRDADFAAESARLTRAQILVQSGTSVLGIANQNPQNVLSLLR
jgi:flagellin